MILEAIDRLDRTIGRLLYFSRPLELDRQLVDLNAICKRTASTWSEKASAVGVAIHCGSGQSDTLVFCDADRLVQVVDHLIEKFVQAVSGGKDPEKSVTLSTSIDGVFANIQVEDTAPGFTPTARAHALDPFFTTKEVGTGLGLSISFEILQAHDGELILSNRERGGATASVRLPWFGIQSRRSKPSLKVRPDMSEILIIDDDPNFRQTLVDLFLDAGDRTLEAVNGREALATLQRAKPALVLCDWEIFTVGFEG